MMPSTTQGSPSIRRQTTQLMAFSEGLALKPTLISNALAALRRFVLSGRGVTFIGAFPAFREVDSAELKTLEIDHPLCKNVFAHLLIKRGPLLVRLPRQSSREACAVRCLHKPGDTVYALTVSPIPPVSYGYDRR